MIRTAHSFSAQRQAIIAGLLAQLHADFVPAFNAEVYDIEKRHADALEFAVEVADDTARNALIARAEATRKARILDLKLRREAFVADLNNQLRMQCRAWAIKYNGEEVEAFEPRRDNPERNRKIVKVVFPDKSSAKMPKSLFIDNNLFQRIAA